MLKQVTLPAQIPAFVRACTHERVFGSRALTALRVYGIEDERAKFYLYEQEGKPAAAFHLAQGVLTVSAVEDIPAEPVAELIRTERVVETDCDERLCLALQEQLGGVTEHSYYMVYRGGAVEGEFPGIVPGELPKVFNVLQRSHEYYREHLDYAVWSADLRSRLSRGMSELYQMEREGKVVGTGSIASEDDECGVIAAVAVVPEYRHQGLGSEISRFLVRRILEKGKTPRLISGYDEVAELYRKLGFESCGRWGELYL